MAAIGQDAYCTVRSIPGGAPKVLTRSQLLMTDSYLPGLLAFFQCFLPL